MIEPTAYENVTGGFWWARYEAPHAKQEWRLIMVKGHAPVLEVYMAQTGDYHQTAMPMRYQDRSPKGSDLYLEFELVFYNKVEGPPSEDGRVS